MIEQGDVAKYIDLCIEVFDLQEIIDLAEARLEELHQQWGENKDDA